MADDQNTDTTQTATVTKTETATETTTVSVEEQQVSKVLRIAGMFWDWFDQRDVEKHLVALFTLFMTFMELRWGMHFAEVNEARPGTDIALVLAAIGVPLTALQAAVINWYFTARTIAVQSALKDQ